MAARNVSRGGSGALDVHIDDYAVRIGERLAVSFQRTLRVPLDGESYPLPPGLGAFPLRRAADHAARVPASWVERGDAFLPMYRREALWLGFRATPWKPSAVQVGVGGVDAVAGGPFGAELTAEPQNYVVCPPQPWLDGINAERGAVRQFVAVELGEGRSVEAALTGREVEGGIQLAVYDPLPGRFPDEPPPAPPPRGPERLSLPEPRALGLGAGGEVRQKVYPDPHGVDAWDPASVARVHVHLVLPDEYRRITGEEPPPSPVDAATYAAHGLPWFELYDDAAGDVPPSERLAGVEGVGADDAAEDASVHVDETRILGIAPRGGRRARVAEHDPRAPRKED